MADKPSYTIDKVGWHTRTPGNTEPTEKTHSRFRAVIDFLQDNGLTVHTILDRSADIDDETAIHTDSLTEEGISILKACYDKWLKKVDRGHPTTDISLFVECLKDRRSN